jgi:hypothetical protein
MTVAAHELEPKLFSNPDSENRFIFASDLAFCGQNDGAVRLIKSSIEGNYCAYQALQSDPLLATIHGMSEFPQLLAAAKQCQDNFLAGRDRLSR